MSSYGKIKVEMYTATEALPVTNGYAVINRIVDGVEVFNQTVYTDDNGQCPEISVETPDEWLSFDPFAIEAPYYEYNIYAYAEGFSNVTIENMQVYPNVLALQTIEMIPRVQTPQNSSGYNFTEEDIIYSVPPNALRQNSQSGPAPFSYCSSPYVLSEVYIPQNITVHLGKPSNTSARNVTVPFIDYIKNVASSEIYPTWPDSALRANIYAQISLALNRVFTEWYPSKGYSYQITNSTQFDQYYVHGRNIFDNISKIVDEIFNVYIRKTGDFQPFYAEYCNGTTATCPGMSQWGTVDLANRGFTPIRILRNYYGNDVNLVESNVIKEIQQSYPGTPLRVGSTGFDVSVIQRQLNRISRNYPLIGNVTVDGNFGTGTENAVKTFQKIFNLTQDGVVGKSTWYKISYIYVAVKKLAELGSEGEPFPPAGPPTQPSQSSLKRGDTGGGVSYLQFMLSYLSTFYTSINDITIDGIFGSGTETAVKQFQSLAKLNVDGIVGKTTWEALVSYYNSLYLDNNPNQVYPGQYYGTVLRQGSTGPQVKEMQFYLQFLSFYYPSIPKIAADGIFGSGTRTAVIAFQNYFGLVADGLVGLQTWTKLFEVFSGIVNGIILPGEKPGVYPGYVLRLGSTGQRVEEVQFYLSVLAKKYPSIPIITPDGKFGVATQNAVIAFQRYFGLAQDGIIGPQTWNKIYTEYFNIRLDPSTLYNFVSISYPGYVLKEGMFGDIISILQYYNNFIGLFDPLIQPVIIDGLFNEETKAAIIEYQKARGICPTGEVGELTWNHIYADYTALFQAVYPSNVPGAISFPGYNLLPGNSGVAVSELQGYLNVIGAFYCPIGFVQQSGVYDNQTTSAVLNFQEIFNLPVTGNVDEQTWNSIYNTYVDLVEISPALFNDNIYSDFFSVYPDRTVNQVRANEFSKTESCISSPSGGTSDVNGNCSCNNLCDIIKNC